MPRTNIPSVDDAAARLGVPVDEIADVLDSPAGTVIKTTDGQSYIDVPADVPDADGQTGLMFLSAPHENYAGGFPVYASTAELDDSAAASDDTGGKGDPGPAGEPAAPKPAKKGVSKRAAKPKPPAAE